MAWDWSIGPWAPGTSRRQAWVGRSGPQMRLSSVTSRQVTVRLLDPSEAKVTLDGRGDDAAMLEDLITDVWIRRDGEAIMRGRMTGPTQDDLAVDTATTTGQFVDYRGVLGRRLLYADQVFTTKAQDQYVWALIAYAQAQPGGDLGIRQDPAWPSTGVTRTITFAAGDYVWPSIKKAGAMSPGFDFDIDLDLVAHLYYPQRGVDSGVTLDYGGVIESARRTFDPAQYGNAVRQSGDSAVTPVTVTASDIATAREGRWDAQYSDTALKTTDAVTATANANLIAAARVAPAYELTFAGGKWHGPGHCWVGDWVTVVLKGGRLADVLEARILEMQIDVDASDVETVKAVVGNVVLDDRAVLRGISQRLTYLQKQR